MPYLILVKHARPAIDPAVPARDWRLGEDGRHGALALAASLSAFGPTCLSASPEPKAAETAAILGQVLGLASQIVDGLEGYLSQDAFEAAIARFFTEPHALVFGEETAAAAGARFATAVERILAADPDATHLIVAHGTVIALEVARRAGVAPFPLWQRLGLPSAIVLDLYDGRVVAELAVATP
jgi:broad specificity phosphatase PhoE